MAGTMLAARYAAPSGRVDVAKVPIPEPGPLEVLVRVEACGICLSDVHLIDGSLPAMIEVVTPGHEAHGVIAEVGDQVTGWRRGDRATIVGGRGCHECVRCRSGRLEECLDPQVMGFHYDGAWAEYVAVPWYALAAVPEGIPPEQAAILADAVATPYAALSERAALRPAESVGLWGIGGLGTHAVQIARLLGAGLVIAVDPRTSARERALALGADVALDPNAVNVEVKVRELTGDLGLDVAVDLFGANAVLRQAASCLARGGRAVMVGMSFEPIAIDEPSVFFGLNSHAVLGHLGYRKQHLDELVTLLARGRLDLSASISDVIPLTDVAEGVRRLASKEGDPVRIVVRP